MGGHERVEKREEWIGGWIEQVEEEFFFFFFWLDSSWLT